MNATLNDIQNYILIKEEQFIIKLNTNNITIEKFNDFKKSLDLIKKYMNRNKIDVIDKKHPLKILSNKILYNCKHINK